MSVARVQHVGRRRRGRPDSLFTNALSKQEQEMLPAARLMEGLEEEIAVLRVKLVRAVKEHPDDLRLMKVGIDALVRAVAAQYRMSPKAKRDFADSLAATLNSLGDQILPPDR